jgi:hypothetical protein
MVIVSYYGPLDEVYSMFVSDDINTIITSGHGPLLQIFLNVTKSKARAICLLLYACPRSTSN